MARTEDESARRQRAEARSDVAQLGKALARLEVALEALDAARNAVLAGVPLGPDRPRAALADMATARECAEAARTNLGPSWRDALARLARAEGGAS